MKETRPRQNLSLSLSLSCTAARRRPSLGPYPMSLPLKIKRIPYCSLFLKSLPTYRLYLHHKLESLDTDLPFCKACARKMHIHFYI